MMLASTTSGGGGVVFDFLSFSSRTAVENTIECNKCPPQSKTKIKGSISDNECVCDQNYYAKRDTSNEANELVCFSCPPNSISEVRALVAQIKERNFLEEELRALGVDQRITDILHLRLMVNKVRSEQNALMVSKKDFNLGVGMVHW